MSRPSHKHRCVLKLLVAEHRHSWTTGDLNALREHVQAGMSDAQLATQLKRTVAAIKAARRRLRQESKAA